MRKLEVWLALDRLLNPLGQSVPYTGDRRDLRDGRLAHRADAPKSPQQRALLGRTDTVDVVQDAADGALRAHLLVVSHREPVGFVPYPLHQIEALRGPREDDRVLSRWHEELLALLGQRRDR